MGFKNFYSAQRTLAGIEVMAMIKKRQMKNKAGDDRSFVALFYFLAALQKTKY
ncbi:MAG: transposase-like protein [Cellvibrionaceae bacterium]|jgi:transposase-like protein